MITAMNIDLIFKNYKEEFEMYITDIFESEHEIEVYTNTLHPTLQRGWVGDMIYQTHRAYELPSANIIDGSLRLSTVKDVLLRSVQCFTVCHDEPIEWKYTFLKD